MSRGLKITMIVAAIVAAAGIALGGLGFALGGMQNVIVSMDGVKLLDETEGGEWVTVDETFEKSEVREIVASLDMVNNLVIEKGDVLSIRGSIQKMNGGLAAKLEGGVLSVSSSEKRINILGSIMNFGDLLDMIRNTEGSGDKNDVTITLPEDVNLSLIKTNLSFGKMTIRDVKTGALDVRSDSGDISVSQVLADKDISIRSSFGRVAVSDATAGSLAIESDSGDIDVFGAELTDLIEVDSSFGKIRVGGVYAKSLRIDSDSGDTEATDVGLSEGLQIYSSFGDIDVSGLINGASKISSDSGDVTLTLENDPGELSVDLDTDSGGIRVNGDKKGGPYLVNAGSGADKLTVDSAFGGIKLDFK
jgi:hypothetical protein